MISRLLRFPSLRLPAAVAAMCLVGLVAGPVVAQADTVVFGTNPSTKLEVSDTNDPVSLSTASKTAYEAYSITFTNQDSRNLSHGSLTDTLPSGSSLASATSSVGSCSSAGGKVTCTLGQVNSGEVITAFIVIQTPSSGSGLANTVSVSFDERLNDKPGPDPKQDTIIATEPTALATTGTASSYVPANAGVEISTDPTGKNVATSTDFEVADVTVPAVHPPTSKSANLDETSDTRCPAGTSPKVCNGGTWIESVIPGSFDPRLVFVFRFDSSILTQSGQTPNNFQMFYEATSTSTPTAFGRCASSNPTPLELPCFSQPVAKLKDGDYLATVVSDHNGRWGP